MHFQSKNRPSKTGAAALPLQPRNSDVLCGRGSTIDEHPGNMHFRQIVNKHKSKYLEVERKGKKEVALALMKLLEQMVPPARFLVRDAYTGNWVEASHETAYNKTTQTLRQTRKQKNKKTSLPLPQNDLRTTTQDSKKDHQELHQHHGAGLQEPKSSSCLHVASMSDDDNPMHGEKQHRGNMFRTTQVPCPFPGMTQSSCFHQQPVNQTSLTAIFPNAYNDARKNPNKRSTCTNEENPVPVPDRSEEHQETTGTKGDLSMAFTSDEANYLSKVLLGDKHQHNHNKRKSSSSRPTVQCPKEHSMALCSPKKRQRIMHAEKTKQVLKFDDDLEDYTAVTSKGTVGGVEFAEHIELLANDILGESDACHGVKSEFTKLDHQIYFEDDTVSHEVTSTKEDILCVFNV